MIDSHCHLDCDAYFDDRDAVIDRARDAGVEAIVVPAVDEPSWQAIRDLKQRTTAPRIHAALGIHPVALPAIQAAGDEALLQRLAAEIANGDVVAVGECGLDTTIDLKLADLPRQERVLAAQVRIAREHSLPLVLHARGPGCYDHLLRFLEALPAGWRGVLHSYGGGADLLKRFLPLPLMFGFAGPSTYLSARRVKASIAAVPDDRLLVETDAPEQTPEPHRPGRNEPAYLVEIVKGVAAVRGTTPDVITRMTTENANRLFGGRL